MLNELIKKANKLYESTNDEKYKIIINLLNNDKLFLDTDYETIYNVLKDLEYSDDEIKKIYIDMVKVSK